MSDPTRLGKEQCEDALLEALELSELYMELQGSLQQCMKKGLLNISRSKMALPKGLLGEFYYKEYMQPGRRVECARESQGIDKRNEGGKEKDTHKDTEKDNEVDVERHTNKVKWGTTEVNTDQLEREEVKEVTRKDLFVLSSASASAPSVKQAEQTGGMRDSREEKDNDAQTSYEKCENVEGESDSSRREGLRRRRGRAKDTCAADASTEEITETMQNTVIDAQGPSTQSDEDEQADPILMFSALPPPHLKKAQREFVEALSTAVALANTQCRILKAEQTFRRNRQQQEEPQQMTVSKEQKI